MTYLGLKVEQYNIFVIDPRFHKHIILFSVLLVKVGITVVSPESLFARSERRFAR